MKILLTDIETAPNVADVWGLWGQNVSLNQLHRPSYMLSFAAKWYGEPAKKTRFFGLDTLDRTELAGEAFKLLEEADAVVTYNGDRFDIPIFNAEMAIHGFTPPAPYKSIDLLKVVKKNFRFPSNKLQFVSTAFGLEGKVQHSGHSLWTRVIAGEPAAWREFKKYNVQDVVLLEELYDKLIPWMHNGLNHNLFGGQGCPNCGSGNIQNRGFSYTTLGKYQRFVCNDCGKWGKDTKRIDSTGKAGL